MSDRPHRHLCPEADMRDAMSDEEFWQHVHANLVGPVDDSGHPDYYDVPDLDAAMSVGVCGVCGSDGACGYDSEGRPMIHATEGDA